MAGIFALAQACSGPPSKSVEPHRPTRIVDASGFVGTDVRRFDDYLSFIEEESGIDVRIALDRPPDGVDINAAALELVERLGVGRGTGAQRGLLLYFDLTSHRLKVEVGYGLEGYFPDSYVAFLVNRHAPLFFEADDRSVGLRLLLRLLHARIRDAALGGDFDPAPYLHVSKHLSGGAGSVNDLRDTSQAKLSSSRPSPYSAGNTPSETYAAYLRLMSDSDWQPDSDLFTTQSRQFLKKLPMSRAYKDFILFGEYGRSWRVEQTEDLALLFFTGTPFVSPHFFVRQDAVWRIDLVAEVENTKERVGGPLTWCYEGRDDAYTTAFSTLLTVVQGCRRIAAGDNRFIPTVAKPM